MANKWYGVLNPYIMADDHGYDGNYINWIIDLKDSQTVNPIMGSVLDG